MAYLLIEGLKYTKSFKRYIRRLLGYAILSIIPFQLALNNHQPIYLFNNILFTLSIGLIMIKLMDMNKRPYKKTSTFDCFILIIATLLTIKSDWNIIGIILIWILYKHQSNYKSILTIFALTLTFIEYTATLNISSFNYLGMLLVIPLLNNYNGDKGFSNNITKYGFYLYYPLHLTILWLISLYLNW